MFKADDLVFAAPGIADGPVVMGIRPEQVQIVDASAADAIRFEVDVVELVEPDVLVFARSGSSSIIVRTPNDDRDFGHGAPLMLRFPPDALHAFDAASGARLA